ncbi:urease accessory protein [Rhodospirillales bacterium URHD0017]|nr:urease accessory protein [Rhodospirillales bacterium URHD0017]
MAAYRRLGVLAIMMVIAEPAWAHHVMGGKLPQTFLQGLLSGFGHPVIGIDHLAAIVGVGILAALAGRSAAVVLAFSVAVIAGVGLHLARIDLPASELFVGLTTLLIGALVIARQSMGAGVAALLFAIAGLVHGYALGESIVGAEASPLIAYLLGLLVIQTAIGISVYAAVRSLARWPARTAGLTVVGVLVALAGGVATAAAAGLA